LTFTTRFGGRINFEYIKDFTSSYVLYDRDNPNLIRRQRPINQLTESRNQLREFTLNNLLNYSAVFGDHDIHALAGYSQIENQSNTLSAYRQQFYNNDVQSIGQGADNATKDNDGADANWGLRSYFGRVNYVFRDKYLFEANARYDGSSRFIGDNQYGFFPSFSGGWRLSQENFWNNLSTTVNEFKIRGSWGKTGNQAVPLYSYFSTLNMINYNFNGQLTPGYAQLSLANSELTWETTTQTNIGLDIAFLNNRISFGVDYYDKRTEGILLLLPVPGTLGLLPVSQNAGRVDNKGWEFQAGIRNDFGGFNLDANFNFNINNNKVVDLAGTGPYITGSDIDPRYIIGEGIPIDAFWGYKTDGYFQTDEEAAAYPQFMRPAKAGDVKVLDLNKDGIINGADMAHIGNTFPKYSFGSSINLSYRSFSLNLLFQGAAKTGVRLARALAEQGNYEGFTPSIITGNYWTPENRNARFPRPTKLDLRNQASTDRMVLDGSYLRLKNIQLGYRLPASVAQKISISGINVYLSATNLLTFSKLNDFKLDPESLSGWQNYYPQISLFTFGLNATF